MQDADADKLFEILVNQNADMLTIYLRASVRDAAAADDIFQETFLVAWRRLSDYDTSRPFGPWLRGIAAKLVLAHYRQSAKRDKPCGPEVLEQMGARLEQWNGLRGDNLGDKLDALRDCVEKLPEKYREPIELRFQDELDLKSAADRLALGIEAVKKRLHRAKKRLLDCLDRQVIVAQGG